MWGCAVEFLPMLLIEVSKEVRQGAAATEDLRNKAADVARGLLQLPPAIKDLDQLSVDEPD